MARLRKLTVTLVTVTLWAAVAGAASAQEAALDFSDEPFVIFAPAPPLPDAISHYPLPDGAEDYWDLWADDAPWADAAAHIDAFATHGWILRYSSTDEELRRMIAWLEEHDIPLGLEVEPLTWPGEDVCDHREGFEGPYELDEATPTSRTWWARRVHLARRALCQCSRLRRARRLWLPRRAGRR